MKPPVIKLEPNRKGPISGKPQTSQHLKDHQTVVDNNFNSILDLLLYAHERSCLPFHFVHVAILCEYLAGLQ